MYHTNHIIIALVHLQLLLLLLLLHPILHPASALAPQVACWRDRHEIRADAAQFADRHNALFDHVHLPRFTNKDMRANMHPRLFTTAAEWEQLVSRYAAQLTQSRLAHPWPHLLRQTALNHETIFRDIDHLTTRVSQADRQKYDGRAPNLATSLEYNRYLDTLRPLSAAVNFLTPVPVSALPLCAFWAQVSATSRSPFLQSDGLRKCIEATVTTSVTLLAHHARACAVYHHRDCRAAPLAHDRVQIAQSLAIAYDYLHAHMTAPERRTTRSALVLLVVQHVTDDSPVASTRFLRDAGIYLARLAVATELDDLDEYTAAILSVSKSAAQFERRSLHAFAGRLQTAVVRTTSLFDTAMRDASVIFYNVIDEAALPILAAQRRGANIVTSPHFRNAIFVALQTTLPWTCRHTITLQAEDGPERRDIALAPTFVALMALAYPQGVLPVALWRHVANAYTTSGNDLCVIRRRYVLPLTFLVGALDIRLHQQGTSSQGSYNSAKLAHIGADALPLSFYTKDGGHVVARDGFKDRSTVLNVMVDAHCCQRVNCGIQSASVSLVNGVKSRLWFPTPDNDAQDFTIGKTKRTVCTCDRIADVTDDNHLALITIATGQCTAGHVRQHAETPTTVRTIALIRDSQGRSVMLTAVRLVNGTTSSGELQAVVQLSPNTQVTRHECRGKVCHATLKTTSGDVSFVHVSADTAVRLDATDDERLVLATDASTLWYAVHSRVTDDVNLASREHMGRLHVASRKADFFLGVSGAITRSAATRCDRLRQLQRDSVLELSGKTLMSEETDSTRLVATLMFRAEGDRNFDDIISSCNVQTNARVSFTILDCQDGLLYGVADPDHSKCARVIGEIKSCARGSGSESWHRGLRKGHPYIVRVHVEPLEDSNEDVKVGLRHLIKYRVSVEMPVIDSSSVRVASHGVKQHEKRLHEAVIPETVQRREQGTELDPLWAVRAAAELANREESVRSVCSAESDGTRPEDMPLCNKGKSS